MPNTFKPTKTQDIILNVIKRFGENGATPKQISQETGKSTFTIQAHLKKLLENKLILKTGEHPNIFYLYNSDVSNISTAEVSKDNAYSEFYYLEDINNAKRDINDIDEKLKDKNIENRDLLEAKLRSYQDLFEKLHKQYQNGFPKIIINNFAYITPQAEYLEGLVAFEEWFKNYPNKEKKSKEELFENLQIQLDEIEQLKTIKSLRVYNFIDSTNKLVELVKDEGENQLVYIDHLYYYDKFSLKTFGKTKTAILTYQAKMSQDRGSFIKLMELVMEPILELIKTENINSVCFIQPSIKRDFQFMTIFEKYLSLELPKIQLIKQFKGNTPIQQKSLKTKKEKIINATNTFRVSGIDDELLHKDVNLLLIDDIVGSGASMNIIAGKIKTVYPQVKTITGFAIVGLMAKEGLGTDKSM